MEENDSIGNPKNPRLLFKKLGTCSRTFFYILNREFDNLSDNEERAADLLAGGIMQEGYQCGMLWGAALGVGAESFRRAENSDQAIAMAIVATEHVVKSFISRTGTADCYEFTKVNWKSKFEMAKHMISGKYKICFELAEKWGPEAIQSAFEGLSLEQDGKRQCLSCATEVVRKMGGGEEQAITVAGFAGGLALGGNACGALAASIWMDTLPWSLENPEKSPFFDRRIKNATKDRIKAFYARTDYEILCSKISGQSFKTVDEHTEFVKSGGCADLIDALTD